MDEALRRIEHPAGEGARTFTLVFAEEARRAADDADRALARGEPSPPLTGIPVSVKDLFDVAGHATTAGSIVLRDALPAERDAPVVERLRRAGAVLVGRTTMTEFAYSGIGQNPHYGTPRNPFQRAEGRIPGGSSSGAAIAVTDGMSAVSIGTDTGGSIRIPAAMTGLLGWKPTADRVPTEGMIPLAPSLDSVGPLAWSVEDAALVDAILAGQTPAALDDVDLAGVTLFAPTNHVRDAMDDDVEGAFADALSRLRAAGARVDERPLLSLEALDWIHRKASLGGAESWAWHRDLLARAGDRYDPRVRVRIESGRRVAAADLATLHRERAMWQREVHAELAGYDAIVLPTVPIVAPRIAELARDRDFDRLNALVLRNPFVVNFLDGCALSLPCHEPGKAPVGLMVAGRRGEDRRVLALGRAVERCLGSTSGRRDPRA